MFLSWWPNQVTDCIHFVALKTISTENSEDITILSAVDTENTNFDATVNNHKYDEIKVYIKTWKIKKKINKYARII